MQTKRTSLRELTAEDYPMLFKWRNSEPYRQFVHYRDSRVEELSEFIVEMDRDSKNRKFQFVIESSIKKVPVGLIFTHTYSTENRFCFINVFIDTHYTSHGYGIEAFALLLCFLFEVKKCFKVYVEVLANNKLSLSTIRSAGLIEEGRFKGHKVLDGVRHDVIRFAAYYENCKRFHTILFR